MRKMFAFIPGFLVFSALVTSSADVLRTGPIPGTEQTVSGLVISAEGGSCIIAGEEQRYVLFGKSPLGVRPGDVVSSLCVLDRHEHGGTTYAPLSLTKLGHKPAPPAKPTTLDALCKGKDLLTLVRIKGIVNDISQDEIDSEHRILLLHSNASSISVLVPERIIRATPHFNDILHAEIEITGICYPDFPTSRFYRGPVFRLVGDSPICLIQPAPTDIFNRPPVPFGRMFSPEEITSLGLRTAEGKVTATWDNHLLLSTCSKISDDKGRPLTTFHRVDLPYGIATPDVGISVQVVGQPETDTYHINLSSASWRKSPEELTLENEVAPLQLKDLVTAHNTRTVYDPTAFGRTVRCRGLLSALPITGTSAARLHLMSDGTDVAIDASSCPEALVSLEAGSRLEVTGVCIFDIDNWRPNAPRPKIQGFFIALRTPSDIVVLSHPPWWTAKRLLALVVALVILLAGALVWNRTLDVLATRRGRALADEQVQRSLSELKIDERTRLAVELHDSLSQNLAGIACQVGALKNTFDREPHLAKTRILTVERMLKSSRAELRNCLFDLRSDVMDDPDISSAIRHTLEESEIDAEIAIRFDMPREKLLDSTAHMILSIIRELSSNAVRHGRATRLRIAGSIDNGHLLFSVKDNGCGFDPDTAPGLSEGHFGLDGIRNRVSGFNGKFTVSSSPGGGTRAVVDIPLPSSFLDAASS